MGKRGKQPWSRAKLPVGSVRIRRHGKRARVRMVKVRDDGPKSGRWIALARYWWLHNRGPIPRGMRVLHADGDLLNDNPENYVLGTADDVLVLSREWDSSLDERNRRACAAGAAKHNRERARVTRARGYLPTRWYAVDPDRRIVVNQPHRSRADVARRHVDGINGLANGRGLAGAWLGWPGLGQLDACVMAVLADQGPADLPAVRRRVARLRALHGWGPDARPASYYSAVSRLRRRGWIQSLRLPIGNNRKEYAAGRSALEARRSPCRLVAARGDQIDARFPGYRKVWPDSACEPAGWGATLPAWG